MNDQPISVYYETKLPYYLLTGVFVIGFFVGFLIVGGDYLMNPFFYFLCISIVAFLFVCIYRGSKFYIYQDKIVWQKGSQIMESPWNEFVAIHYDSAPNLRFSTRNYKSYDFFLEMKGGYTKYANEKSIRLQGDSTFGSKAEGLMNAIKSYSGKTEDIGAVSGFKQRQNLWVIVFLLVAMALLAGGGLWYANYQTQSEINAMPWSN